jgi:hypothetical protein
MAVQRPTGTSFYLSSASNVPTGNLTVSLWAYIDSSTGTYGAFFFRGSTNGIDEFPFWGVDSLLVHHVYQGSDLAGSTLSAGVWRHLVCVRNSSTDWKFYVNGTQDIAFTSEATITPALMELFRDGPQWLNPINGQLAAVKIWSAALTVPELVQEGQQYVPFRTANLHSFTPLLSITDMTLDFSGNGNHWTANGTGQVTTSGPPIPWSGDAPALFVPPIVVAGVALPRVAVFSQAVHRAASY